MLLLHSKARVDRAVDGVMKICRPFNLAQGNANPEIPPLVFDANVGAPAH
jgi:hypothetical protein